MSAYKPKLAVVSEKISMLKIVLGKSSNKVGIKLLFLTHVILAKIIVTSIISQ